MQLLADTYMETGEIEKAENLLRYSNFSYIDFLRDVGKYFNIPYMLNKDIRVA